MAIHFIAKKTNAMTFVWVDVLCHLNFFFAHNLYASDILTLKMLFVHFAELVLRVYLPILLGVEKTKRLILTSVSNFTFNMDVVRKRQYSYKWGSCDP